VLFIHREDAGERGFEIGEWVDLISEWDDGERRADRFKLVAFDLPRGDVGAYFPETNPLVPLGSKADKSNTPTSKSVIIRLVKRTEDDASA